MNSHSAQYRNIDGLVDLSTEPIAYALIILVVVAIISIFLRAWAHWGTERAWSVLPISAMVFLIAGTGLNLAMLRYGLGKEDLILSFERLILLCKFSFAIGITYSLCLCLAKLSILEMYLKIFSVQNTRIWIMILAAITTAAGVAHVFTSIFQCSPINEAWLPIPSRNCINLQTAYTGFAIVNIVLDVLIPIVPALRIAKLQADIGRRTVAIVMLVLGSTVLIASSVRLYYFLKTIGHIPPNRDSARLVSLSTVEGALAVTSSCLPLLKPLFVKAITKVRSIGSQSTAARSTRALTDAIASQEKSTPDSLSASHVTSTSSTEVETWTRLRPAQID